MRWDLYCKVIDNHGDLGVCWRLAAGLAAHGQDVRLWIDDASALHWMAPQGCDRVEVRPWAESVNAEPADVVVEAFGCELEPAFVAAIAARTRATGRQPPWINLEYLSAESWVERCHGLPSPVLAGPGEGLTKRFFYPGFTSGTGGLLREADLMDRMKAFDRRDWLAGQGIAWSGERLLSLFCYEPAALEALLRQLADGPQPTRLLVTSGRARAAVDKLLGSADRAGSLQVDRLGLLTQRDFDHLLWSSDLNFVRGEDSLVRALWAGKPLAWNIYPQDDGAHWAKLWAFLDWYRPPPVWRQLAVAWNGGPATLPPLADAIEGYAALDARQRLLAQPDLVTQLLAFVAGRQSQSPESG